MPRPQIALEPLFSYLRPDRLLALALIAVFVAAATPASAASRIKDLVMLEGVRENHVVGYGLVVGLDGTGDSLRNAPFTNQSLIAMLERLGVNTRGSELNTDNVAAVMVTGSLPPFAPQGTRMDVAVSALGDSESLRGGTLLATPLMGADGEVYAVAQGPVAVGGFSAGGASGTTLKRGVPTSGRISNGAIIEREIAFSFADLKNLRIGLINPDMSTAARIADAINSYLGSEVARAHDQMSISLDIPPAYDRNVVALFAELGQLYVEPDQPARVVIDEASGIIVMGENVRVSTVAIAQGNLTIKVTETPQVSQPNPFSETGDTVVVDRTDISIEDDAGNRLAVIEQGVNLQTLVDGLNALGVGPQDMISILQAIKAAGALQAEIEVM